MKPKVTASAPGKIILFGEHAVVYGRPAIAVPVHKVRALATVEPDQPGRGLVLRALDLDREIVLASAPEDEPLACTARLTLAHLDLAPPDAVLTISSTIPIASGLGSGAAVSTAIVRALMRYMCEEPDAATVSRLVYEVEKLYHGTPSGVDNTVIAYGRPVYFVRLETARIEVFESGRPLHLVIGDTGLASSTRATVSAVRQGWLKDRHRFEALFDGIGKLVDRAQRLIASGEDEMHLGELMDRNHAQLREMGVSSPELERLVAAAKSAGALGAKLSGGGRGGNMVALVASQRGPKVVRALRKAGARRVIETVLEPGS
jgi:mevalonate kinase